MRKIMYLPPDLFDLDNHNRRTHKDSRKRESIPDDQIIIPNSKIPLQVGGLESFSMDMSEFNDRIYKYKDSFDVSEFAKDPKKIYVKNVRLDNGFCYAETLCSDDCLDIKFVVIFYIDKTQKIASYLPLAGNNVNRITEKVPSGNDDDMFWLWENINWGKPRPREPIKYDLSEFQRLMISYELIEAEIASKATIVPKEKKVKNEALP